MTRLLALAAASCATLGCADMVTDLVEYAVIEVEATSLSGGPVPGVEVTLHVWPPRELAAADTDENGRAVFEFVPPNNGYAVQGDPPDEYARPEELYGGPSTQWVDGLYLEPGDTARVQFQYVNVGPGSIAVWVMEPDGSPVSGARLAAYNIKGTVVRAETGPEGYWRFEELPFGQWGVQAIPPIEYDFGPGDVQYVDGFLVEENLENEARFVMDLAALPRCDGAILVEVGDQHGAPVSSFPLRLYNHVEVLRTASTGPDGTYLFSDLLCGSYGVALEPRRGYIVAPGRGSSYLDGFHVAPGMGTMAATFTFTVTRCAGFIAVGVVDGSAAPVPDAVLELYTSAGTIETRRSDGAGMATFPEVTCGVEHGVAVTPPAGFVPIGPGYVDRIKVADGETHSVTLELRRTG